MGERLGEEIRGVPMGDALSCSALRLFKWARERICLSVDAQLCIRYPGMRIQLARIQKNNVLILDGSFRDDVRQFCAWDSSADLDPAIVQQWAGQRFCSRFVIGSMEIEPSDPDLFIGVRTCWRLGRIELKPDFHNPWGAFSYSDVDRTPLKPWCSWGPPAQRFATVHALLARCYYYSLTRECRITAIWEAFIALIHLASFPREFVFRTARKWAVSWKPSSRFSSFISVDPAEVESAIRHFNSV